MVQNGKTRFLSFINISSLIGWLQASCEVIRDLSLEVLEVGLDFKHVGFQVTCRVDGTGALNESAFVVKAIEKDGKVGF